MLSLPVVASLALAVAVAAHPTEKRQQQYSSPNSFGKLINATRFDTINGTFLSDLSSTNQSTYDIYNSSSQFGLINGNWSNFTSYVDSLNAGADASTSYKVVYIARHGEGYHNTEQDYVGDGAWNCYWAQQAGNGSVEWADALLTPAGVAQAQRAGQSWMQQLSAGAPFPQTFFSSPLSRAASTLNITWSSMLGNNKPTFKELWRASIGLQTCNERRNATYLAATYPQFDFEAGFAQVDPLWQPGLQETSAQLAARTFTALSQLFATNPAVYISITAHSETVSGLMTVINHIPWSTQRGGMVPVLIRATNATAAATTSLGSSTPAPPCTTPVSTIMSSAVQGSFNPNPSSLPTTAPPSGSGVPANPTASASPQFTNRA